MLYVDKTGGTFTLVLTLGAADTTLPPPLLLLIARPGTNTTATIDLDAEGVVTPGATSVTITDLPTTLVPESGTWEFTVQDNTTPGTPVELERGLLIATTTPITKQQYGTDKKRGEYKGHL